MQAARDDGEEDDDHVLTKNSYYLDLELYILKHLNSKYN